MKIKLLLLLFVISSCLQKTNDPKKSNEPLKHLDPSMEASSRSYDLASVESISIDGKEYPCQITAMYETPGKEIFLLGIYTKDASGRIVSTYIMHYANGELVQIISSNIPQTEGLSLYKFQNGKLSEKVENGLKIEKLDDFVKTERSLYRQIEKELKKL